MHLYLHCPQMQSDILVAHVISEPLNPPLFYCFLSLLVVAIFQSHQVLLPECTFSHDGSLTVFS